MTTANIIAWIVIGAIVGILFALARKPEMSGTTLLDLIVGAVGGIIGGIILNALGGIVGAEVIGVNLGGALIAIIGALILVFVLELVRRPSQ